MFSRLIKKVFTETTNISDITPVTFNATGNYNPRYGKSRQYVSGKGAAGSYIAGTANYNVVAGTANYTTVTGTANYTTVTGNANYNTVNGFDVYYTATGNAEYYNTGGNAIYSTVTGTANYYAPTAVAATSNSTANYTNNSGGTIYGSYVNETSFSSNNYSTYGQGPVNAGSAYSAGYNTWYRTTTYQYYSAIAFSPGNNANYNASNLNATTYNASNLNATTYNAATPGTIGYMSYVAQGWNVNYAKGAPNTYFNTTLYRTVGVNYYYTLYYALYTTPLPSPSYIYSGAYTENQGPVPKASALPANYANTNYYSLTAVDGVIPIQSIPGTYNTQNAIPGTYNTQTVASYNTPNAYSAFRIWYNVQYLTVYDSNAFTQLGNVSGNNNPSFPHNGNNAITPVLWYYNTNYPYWYTNNTNYPYANTNATNYPYANTNATNYPYANTNANITNTGGSSSVLGITLPGGYGGPSTVVPATLASSIPKYGTTTPVTVPSGGYVTITFTL
jgi:hypothetical protein